MVSESDFLAVELQRLDLLLQREILRLRAAYQLSLDEFRGLYVSDEQVDNLVNMGRADSSASPSISQLTQQAAALREANSARLSPDSPWSRLAAEFSLSSGEQDIILLALAPEVDLKYETIYAYLNNDITRKWPTVDLALRVLAASPLEKPNLRRRLVPQSTLFAKNLICSIEPSPPRSSLADGFFLNAAVTRFLLSDGRQGVAHAAFVETPELCPGWEDLPLPEADLERLRRFGDFFKAFENNRRAPVVVFEGREGSGRELAAAAVCNELGLPLLKIDLQSARAAGSPVQQLIAAAILQSRLEPAGLYLAGAESLFDGEGRLFHESCLIAPALEPGKQPVFFSCVPGTRWQQLLGRRPTLCFCLQDPDYPRRLQLWSNALQDRGPAIPEAELRTLAGRFILNPGQITAAAAAAFDSHRLGDPGQPLDSAILFQAARQQSDRSLGNLAVKVKPVHTWGDLVLPAVTLARVRELAAAIRNCHVVYSEWGFERRLAAGRGVKALFSGSSGTGKTMTASVIAADLGLDLYKIDLSGVVSKYIGETEKNLDRIFGAARASNAILFFDEADALFGKRSEVKDAHDRYANIEIAYLLQKVEDHEGLVILASNLSRNIDAAFSRRLHYVIDFPLPDEDSRELLWRQMFPPETPLAQEVDWCFLAKQFALAGGDIKNVALEAAFLAAQDGRVITMQQLVRALARQLLKQGRIPSATDFKQYYGLIA